MATAVVEELAPATTRAVRGVELAIVPGITAAAAAAAAVGAPLGHDFCCLSLSDVLKPWAVVERRLEAVGAADLVVALYNPISRHRPWQLGRALEILARPPSRRRRRSSSAATSGAPARAHDGDDARATSTPTTSTCARS